MDQLLTPVLRFAADGLEAVASALAPWAGPAAAAAAVVLITLLVRAALVPVGVAQARAEQARSRLAPRLAELRRRYGRSPERLQRETMALYRAENVSPFAGCLPVLAQAPVVGLLYAVFLHPTIGGETNALLADTLFGVPLGTSLVPGIIAGTLPTTGLAVLGAVVILIAGCGELTRRLLRVPPIPNAPAGTAGALGALQFATAAVAAFVPLAAGLYLLVTAGWTLGQRLILRRRYPLT